MKEILFVFWGSTVRWAALVAVGLLLVSAVSGSMADALSQAPVWLGMALVLAAYPGGLSAAEPVYAEEGGWMARSLSLASAGLSASVVSFFVTNVLAPALIDFVPGDVIDATHGMDLGALREALRAAREAAEAGPPTPVTWLPYNHLAFHYVRRLDGMLLPALFAVVGLLTGYWTRSIEARALRSLGTWGLGAFLLLTTYMAGENGCELIDTRAAGPVAFVGDLVFIVPGTLIVGLGMAQIAHRLALDAR